MTLKIIVGLRIEKLEILEEVTRISGGDRRWRVRCDCGAVFVDTSCHLRRRKSCGSHACRKRRSDGNGGHAPADKGKRTPEYQTWCSMRKRCRYRRDPRWKDYGGRGITFCERWERFESFLEDMGRRPSPNHSLDRIDNEGDYAPDNCRWATRQQQMRNRRGNVWIEYGGRRLIMAEWSRLTGLPEKMLQARKRLGWSDERILTEAPKPDRRRRIPIVFRGPATLRTCRSRS